MTTRGTAITANETGTRMRGRPRGAGKAAEIDNNGGGTATLAKPRGRSRSQAGANGTATRRKANAATAHKTGTAEAVARLMIDRLGEMRLFGCEPGDWETLGEGQRAYLIDAIEGGGAV